jgi:hypothetical protein
MKRAQPHELLPRANDRRRRQTNAKRTSPPLFLRLGCLKLEYLDHIHRHGSPDTVGDGLIVGFTVR